MVMLTVEDVAALKGCTRQHIAKTIVAGKLNAQTVTNANNRPKYLIPLTELDEPLQHKYYKTHAPENIASVLPTKAESKPFDEFTSAEREKAVFWKQLLEEWQCYRNKQCNKSKAEADEDFVRYCAVKYEDVQVSTKILYRKYSALKKGEFEKLPDNRGKHRKGQSSITKEMMDTILNYYLDQAQHPVARCYKFMKDSVKLDFPEQYELIPSEATFRRHIESDVNEMLKIYGREGEDAYRNACGLYIRREYDNIASDDYWIGDTHTIDVQSLAEDGKIHRLYLSAWMDARSGVMVGWHISSSPSSQTSLLALRDGMIRRKTIPKTVYVDNGREFLTFDFGGLGHRAKKSKNNANRFEPPTILQRLGIKMINALVKNARAKAIERRFLDFKNQISRLFDTYTGGNVVERPEILKARIKNGNIIVDKQLIEEIDSIIEYYFNYEEYGGAVRSDHHKRKIDVYSEYATEARRVPEQEMHLMLMRSTRAQTVGKRGVHIKVSGEQFDYCSDELKQAMFGKKVYCRYDPYKLESVRVYDVDGSFIMEAPSINNTVLNLGASTDDVKEANRIIRASEKRTREEFLEIKAMGRRTAKELVLARVLENKNNPASLPNPKVINIQRAIEELLFKQAVGDIDLGRMNKNASQKRGGNINE